MVERAPEKREVTGSTPVPTTAGTPGWRRAAVPVAALLAAAALLPGCRTGTERRQIAAAIVGDGAGWLPSTVAVGNRNQVVLRVGNNTTNPHGFTIEGYDIRRTLEPGVAQEIKFKARKNGVFKIFCQLHETHQTATLIVR